MTGQPAGQARGSHQNCELECVAFQRSELAIFERVLEPASAPAAPEVELGAGGEDVEEAVPGPEEAEPDVEPEDAEPDVELGAGLATAKSEPVRTVTWVPGMVPPSAMTASPAISESTFSAWAM